MKTYIALLRGINVSGKNIIKMEALKKLFFDLGFEKVQTYIQSGNVIFTNNQNLSKTDLAQLITSKIKATFELNIPVLILENEELKTNIALLPFFDFEEKNIYLTFLNEYTKVSNFDKILEKKSEGETIIITENVVYLECKNGYGNKKLTNVVLEKQLNVLCTTRNLKTSKKILELSTDF